MKKELLSILASIVLVANIGAAASDNVIFSDGEATVTGTTAKSAAVSVTVLKKGVSIDEFNLSSQPTDYCVGYRQAATDSEGNYSVTLNIGTKSGEYEVFAGTGGEQISHSVLKYVNKSENAAALSTLGDIFDKSGDERYADFASLLAANADALGANSALAEAADPTETAKIFFASVTKNAAADYLSAAAAVNKALAIDCINKGKITLTGAAENLNLPQTVSDYLGKDFVSDSAKAYIDSKMAHAADFNSFDKAAAEAVSLGVIRYADGFGHVKACLAANGSLLGIDTARVTDKFAASIVGNDYDSVAATGVNTWVDPVTPTLGGGGTGGGKGGSSLGGSVSNITVDGDTNNATPIDRTPAAFTDMAGFEWASDAVNALRTKSIISGKADGIFAPGDSVLREEFIKMLLGAVTFEDLYGSVSFADVSADDWFEPFVRKAYLAGIAKGVSATEFGTGETITRQDMAVMCFNALVKKGVMTDTEGEPLTYSDAAQIADYAANAVAALGKVGIMRGDENGAFRPDVNATRAEAAQLIYGTMNYAGR